MIPDVPVGSVVEQVLATDIGEKYDLVVHSQLSNKTQRHSNRNSPDSKRECHKDPSSSRFPLCIDSTSGCIRTTTAFKAIPGDKLTVHYSKGSGLTADRVQLVITVVCPFNETQSFYRQLIYHYFKYKCLNIMHIDAKNTKSYEIFWTYTYSHRKHSYYDSLMMEIDMNKVAPYVKQKDLVMANFDYTNIRYSNQTVPGTISSRRLIFSAKAKSKDNFVRVPMDEVFTYNIDSIDVSFMLVGQPDYSKILKSYSFTKYLPFLKGAVKFVMLSWNSTKCNKSECANTSREGPTGDGSKKTCLTIDQLYSACYCKYRDFNACQNSWNTKLIFSHSLDLPYGGGFFHSKGTWECAAR